MRSTIVPLFVPASMLFGMLTMQACFGPGPGYYGGSAYAPGPVVYGGPYGAYDRGDYDEQRQWHERDWWVQNRQDWVNQHHKEWVAPAAHPQAGGEHHEAGGGHEGGHDEHH